MSVLEDSEYPVLEGEGDYSGGSEGKSLFVWQRIRTGIPGNSVSFSFAEKITSERSSKYSTTAADRNCQLQFG